jgi:hypothetical protein
MNSNFVLALIVSTVYDCSQLSLEIAIFYSWEQRKIYWENNVCMHACVCARVRVLVFKCILFCTETKFKML